MKNERPEWQDWVDEIISHFHATTITYEQMRQNCRAFRDYNAKLNERLMRRREDYFQPETGATQRSCSVTSGDERSVKVTYPSTKNLDKSADQRIIF